MLIRSGLVDDPAVPSFWVALLKGASHRGERDALAALWLSGFGRDYGRAGHAAWVTSCRSRSSPRSVTDEISAVRLQPVRLPVLLDGDDHLELSGPAGFDAVESCLEDDRALRTDSQMPACGEQHVRRRLPPQLL